MGVQRVDRRDHLSSCKARDGESRGRQEAQARELSRTQGMARKCIVVGLKVFAFRSLFSYLSKLDFVSIFELQSEVNYLGQLRHKNLVKLIGYCSESDNRLLVYEFMPKGSLENHLFRSEYKIVKQVKFSANFKAKSSLKQVHLVLEFFFFNHTFPLQAEGVQPISWALRMTIAIGVARGLSFLHGLDANVIYRDLKASNILLDSVRMETLEILLFTCSR